MRLLLTHAGSFDALVQATRFAGAAMVRPRFPFSSGVCFFYLEGSDVLDGRQVSGNDLMALQADHSLHGMMDLWCQWRIRIQHGAAS